MSYKSKFSFFLIFVFVIFGILLSAQKTGAAFIGSFWVQDLSRPAYPMFRGKCTPDTTSKPKEERCVLMFDNDSSFSSPALNLVISLNKSFVDYNWEYKAPFEVLPYYQLLHWKVKIQARDCTEGNYFMGSYSCTTWGSWYDSGVEKLGTDFTILPLREFIRLASVDDNDPLQPVFTWQSQVFGRDKYAPLYYFLRTVSPVPFPGGPAPRFGPEFRLQVADNQAFTSPLIDTGWLVGSLYDPICKWNFYGNMNTDRTRICSYQVLVNALPLNKTLYWRLNSKLYYCPLYSSGDDPLCGATGWVIGKEFTLGKKPLPITRIRGALQVLTPAGLSGIAKTPWITASNSSFISWSSSAGNPASAFIGIEADYLAGEKPLTRVEVCLTGEINNGCTGWRTPDISLISSGTAVGSNSTGPLGIDDLKIGLKADSLATEKPIGQIRLAIRGDSPSTYTTYTPWVRVGDGLFWSNENYGDGLDTLIGATPYIGLWDNAEEMIPPPSITAFTAEAICQVSVEQPATRLSWSADNADFYNVWRNKQGETIQVYDPMRRVWITRTAWYNISGDITLTNYLDTTANEPGQQYNYYIVAKSSVGTAKSVTKSATALDCNSPPRVDAGLNKNVWETQSVILEGSASDKDPMTFQWSGTCLPYLSDTTILRPNFTALEVASNTNYDCVLTATDSKGASSSDTMLITVQDTSLSVSLSANPISGTVPLTGVDLTASVSKIGPNLTFNYTFYCNRFDSGTNIISPWDYKRDFVTTNPLTALDVCNYTSAGVKYAKVIVEWFNKAAESRVRIDVINLAPSATNLSVSQPNYCVFSPSAVFNWTFSDPDGHTQSAYQVQVDNNSIFSSPESDSGKVNSSSNAYSTGPGKLQYNQTYYWRVRVWDSYGQASALANGPFFSTPRHQYPTADFIWSPQNPSAQEEVQFIDASVVFGGTTKSTWNWTFQNGQPSSSLEQNPLVKFLSFGSKDVTLKITDSDNYACSVKKTLQAKLPLPKWKEVIPQ